MVSEEKMLLIAFVIVVIGSLNWLITALRMDQRAHIPDLFDYLSLQEYAYYVYILVGASTGYILVNNKKFLSDSVLSLLKLE